MSRRDHSRALPGKGRVLNKRTGVQERVNLDISERSLEKALQRGSEKESKSPHRTAKDRQRKEKVGSDSFQGARRGAGGFCGPSC